jgi:hypothetical protein
MALRTVSISTLPPNAGELATLSNFALMARSCSIRLERRAMSTSGSLTSDKTRGTSTGMTGGSTFLRPT